jgi:hypothetical protein
VPAGEVKAEHLSGLALRWDQGPWSLRYGHHSLEFDTAVPAIERLLSELSSGRTGCSNCASVLAARVPTRGIHSRIHSLALQYDSGPWLLTAEATSRDANSTLAARSRAWYVLAAHRWGDWSPYVLLGQMQFREPPLGLQTLAQAGPMAAAVNARIDRYLQTPNDRRIWQLGLRWDFRERMALKVQLEGYRSTGEPGLGQSNFLEVPSPPPIGSYTGPVWDGRVRQVSINLDFLF